jgi:hypothetical protein
MYYDARWYDPALGRFVSPDTLVSDPSNPQSLNRYAYVLANPLKYSDPTGHIGQGREAEVALSRIEELQSVYGVYIDADFGWRWVDSLGRQVWAEGVWRFHELTTVLSAIRELAGVMGGARVFRHNLQGVRIVRHSVGEYAGFGDAHKVRLRLHTLGGFGKWTVVHEMAHAWDAVNGWQLSDDLQKAMGAGFPDIELHEQYPDDDAYWYDPGDGPPPCGINKSFNAHEDFAESVAAYVYPDRAAIAARERQWPYHDPFRGYSYAGFHDTPRGQHIHSLTVDYFDQWVPSMVQ